MGSGALGPLARQGVVRGGGLGDRKTCGGRGDWQFDFVYTRVRLAFRTQLEI